MNPEASISFRTYKKNNNKWEIGMRDSSTKNTESKVATQIYKAFGAYMTAKYINKVPWIKRVESHSNYDGTYTYTFYQTDGYKAVFVIDR